MFIFLLHILVQKNRWSPVLGNGSSFVVCNYHVHKYLSVIMYDTIDQNVSKVESCQMNEYRCKVIYMLYNEI